MQIKILMSDQLTPRQRLLELLIAERDRTKEIVERIEKLPKEDFSRNDVASMNGIVAISTINHERMLGEYYKITKPVY